MKCREICEDKIDSFINQDKKDKKNYTSLLDNSIIDIGFLSKDSIIFVLLHVTRNSASFILYTIVYLAGSKGCRFAGLHVDPRKVDLGIKLGHEHL